MCETGTSVPVSLVTRGGADQILLRADRGLYHAGDRIRLEVAGDAAVVAAIEIHEAWIAEQVLAVELVVGTGPGAEGWRAVVLADGVKVQFRITKVDQAL